MDELTLLRTYRDDVPAYDETSWRDAASILRERIESVDTPAKPASQWRHRRRSFVFSLATVIVLAAAAVPAFGLDRQFGELFSSSPSAPAREQVEFQSLDVEAPAGMAPGVVAGEARQVIDTTLSTGEHVTLSLNPTQKGGFCSNLTIESPDGTDRGGGGGCDSNRELQLAIGSTIPGPIRDGKILAPPVVLSGSVLVPSAERIELVYQDGATANIPITWVSDPINAGFFVYGIPESHWTEGHKPTRVIALDASGKPVIEKDWVLLAGIPCVPNTC